MEPRKGFMRFPIWPIHAAIPYSHQWIERWILVAHLSKQIPQSSGLLGFGVFIHMLATYTFHRWSTWNYSTPCQTHVFFKQYFCEQNQVTNIFMPQELAFYLAIILLE
jgi:hypothetical protein